jgi:hypothetical protein
MARSLRFPEFVSTIRVTTGSSHEEAVCRHGHGRPDRARTSRNATGPALVHRSAQVDEQASADQRKDVAIIPGADAGAAAEGNLTPVYIGASVAGAAVIAGALTGGGHRDGTGGTGGTTGTTGTH